MSEPIPSGDTVGEAVTTDGRPILHVRADGRTAVRLSVAEVMENSGGYCGSGWGWVTLQEIVDGGCGVDTDGEVWSSDRPEVVAAQMRAYWDAHPCLHDTEAECLLHEHDEEYCEPPGWAG